MTSSSNPTACKPSTACKPYRWTWFDWFCLWYPPGWLILLNRHWQHYHPDSQGWNWLEFLLFLIPGGFYLAMLLRWVRLGFRMPRSQPRSFEPTYQKAFQAEVLTPIVQHYFRSELHPGENLPSNGPVIVVMNHAGMCFPWDFLNLASLLNQHQGWSVHPLAGTALFEHPWMRWWLPSGWSQALGGVRAEKDEFEAAMAESTILLYAPEGLRGPQKGWLQRYQLQTFHPSFVQLSDRYNIPILPILCLGNEGLNAPAINLKPLTRLLGLPFTPLSPWMLLFVLFPSMGVWAARRRLHYFVQPSHPPGLTADSSEPAPSHSLAYRRAQVLRSKLQQGLNRLLDC